LNIYTINKEIASQSEKISKAYQEISNYFNGDLFAKKEIKPLYRCQ